MTPNFRIFLAVLVLLVIGLFSRAHAAITLEANPTEGVSPFSTRLTWNAEGATTCTAAGMFNWEGSVPTSGERGFSNLRVSKSISLTCDTGSSDPLSWTHSGMNTDGTPAQLLGFRIHYGESAEMLHEVIQVNDPNATSYSLNLPAGTYYFAVQAFNVDMASELSNIVQRSVGDSETVTIELKVNKQPEAPVIH